MAKCTQFFFILFINIYIEFIDADSCSLKLSNKIPKNEPVYLVENSKNGIELFDAIGEKSEIESSLILYCPGNRNTIINSNENSKQISCDTRFQTNLNHLNCTKQVSGDLRTTNRQCLLNNRRGLIYEIGFFVNDEFAKLFEVCYDSDNASSLYAFHQINGKSIKFSIKESNRVGFKTFGTPKRARPEQNYRIQNQLKQFRKILGSHQKYFSNSTFLSRGHFAPDADFIFSSHQFATYFYANVCPQFQSINGGNWVQVEMITRRMAEQSQTNLNIYTGAYDQLALPSESGDLIPLYLSDTNQIEVPKYIWKIVHNQRTQSAIVFVTLNNPHANKREVNELCPNICSRAGINKIQFNTIKKGFTVCCEYNTFSRIIPSFQLSVRNLLILNEK